MPLSEAGFKGVVYKYDKDNKSYVIKVARNPEFKFENEAQTLKQVPKGINCQRFVTYFQHPSSNCDILVSTFVDGEKRVLKNPKDFKQFFDLLLELDKSGVLHGDLNMQNCLFSSKGIGLIDFGEGGAFKTGDTFDGFIYPEFVLKSNVVNHGLALNNSFLDYTVESILPTSINEVVMEQITKVVLLGNSSSKVEPIMYINHDDVIGKHGNTIGKFNDDEIFYLMSRGISKNEAIKLLIKGFIFAIIEGNLNFREDILKIILKVGGENDE